MIIGMIWAIMHNITAMIMLSVAVATPCNSGLVNITFIIGSGLVIK